ncbi:hypothetical protein H7F33_20640 [Pedobacter sp. PAMC26386]|nr:hypothetical protein H7F33_20640 [Pedobacter sp. PAMC26386]
MKNLFNISPFILLLAPVFVLMILTFTTSANRADQTAETAAKTNITTASSLDKASVSIAKQ